MKSQKYISILQVSPRSLEKVSKMFRDGGVRDRKTPAERAKAVCTRVRRWLWQRVHNNTILYVMFHPTSRPSSFLVPETSRARKKVLFLLCCCKSHFCQAAYLSHSFPLEGRSVGNGYFIFEEKSKVLLCFLLLALLFLFQTMLPSYDKAM